MMLSKLEPNDQPVSYEQASHIAKIICKHLSTDKEGKNLKKEHFGLICLNQTDKIGEFFPDTEQVSIVQIIDALTECWNNS